MVALVELQMSQLDWFHLQANVTLWIILSRCVLVGTSICPGFLAKSDRWRCLLQLGFLKHHKCDLPPSYSTFTANIPESLKPMNFWFWRELFLLKSGRPLIPCGCIKIPESRRMGNVPSFPPPAEAIVK